MTTKAQGWVFLPLGAYVAAVITASSTSFGIGSERK
jgi:hypothetical protein